MFTLISTCHNCGSNILNERETKGRNTKLRRERIAGTIHAIRKRRKIAFIKVKARRA